ncbi:DUF481 domain-containing protein [Nitrospira sp.]|nr:DUF481 domain-containing protein [Nitrospira sp.]
MWPVALFVLTSVLLVGAGTANAEDTGSQEELPDRFMIRGGAAYVFNADTTFGINGSSGLGALVDFSQVLKGQRDDFSWRIDSYYRFNPRHSVGFSYYNVRRKGDARLDADINVGDTTFAAGGQVLSTLDIGLYRFYYNYSFHHDEKVELAGSVGLYFADIGLNLSGNLTCTGSPSCTGLPQTPRAESSTLTVPLPSLGFLVKYNFTPRLQAHARFDWFYVDTGNFQGDMNELYLGLEYRLFKHFSIGAAFNRLDVNVKYLPDQGSGFNVSNNWNMLYGFGSLYF